MSVAVIVPWRPGCPHRERSWAWVRAWWSTQFPVWPIVTGAAEGDFNRAPAICRAAHEISASVFVIADADVWCDGIGAAVEAVHAGAPWAIPHDLLHRLDQRTSERVLAGGARDPVGYDQKPYRGHAAGTLLVVTADALATAPPDRRFAGWGQEDDAWAYALTTLVGEPWRGDADLWHLWHPHPERLTRRIGNAEGRALYHRYRRARGDREYMAELVAESTARQGG